MIGLIGSCFRVPPQLWNKFSDQELSASKLRVSVRSLCAVSDCRMALLVNGKVAFADSKFRKPWRVWLWDSAAGAGVLICDQSAMNLMGFVRSSDRRWLEEKESRDLLQKSMAEADSSGSPLAVAKSFCGDVPMTQAELDRSGSIFLTEAGQRRRLR
ncbi:hypothetical protein WDZ92_09325 [Nostoc sp. NIES-2111]